jgi:hypothetical protein
MTGNDAPRRVEQLRDLGTMEPVPAGTRVYVEEDHTTYISAGTTTPAIAQRIGWEHANIWIPDHVLIRMTARPLPFVDIISVASIVMRRPSSVHQGTRQTNHVYFIVEASVIRDAGLLLSRSARFVDAVVELRHVSGGNILRLFHLSPRGKNQGGAQLWP